MRIALRTFFLCLIVHFTVAETSFIPLKVTPTEKYNLNKHLYHFQTPNETISVFDAIIYREKGFFKPTHSTTSRQEWGYNTDVHCLYFELEGNEQVPELMLEVEYSNLDELELFEVIDGKVKSLGLTGDIYPFSHRPISNNNYVFSIQPKPAVKTGYYLIINNRNAILSFYLHLTQANHFKETDRWEYGLWGIFTGVILIILVINTFMWYDTKDRIYFWYNTYIIFVMLHLYSDAGLGFQFIWNNFPAFNTYNPVYIMVWLALVAQIIFMQHFIGQTSTDRPFKWVNLYKYLVLITFGSIVFIQFFGLEGEHKFVYKTLVSCTSYFVVGMVGLATWSLMDAYYQSEKLVRYYGFALGVQFLGYFFAMMINLLQDQGGSLPFEIETYTIVATSVLIDVAFFSYGLSYRYDFFKRKNQTLALEILKVQQELSSKVIETLEEERRRIAQDLHDDVGATLATAKGFLSTLTKKSEMNANTQHLLKSQELLDKASEDLRAISHNLMPKSFSKLGICRALEETIRKVSIRDAIDFNFISIGKEKRMDQKVEMQLFRIATELINTILKHANATEATLQLVYHHDYLNLIVEDNGRELEETDRKRSGFRNLQSRVALLNANIEIDSNTNGTTVIIEMPYQEIIA